MGTNQNRRTFLHDGSLLLLGAGLASTSVSSLLADDAQRRVGIAVKGQRGEGNFSTVHAA